MAPAASASPVAAVAPGGASASAATNYPAGGKYSTLDAVGRTGGKIVEVMSAEARHFSPLASSDQVSNPRILMLFNGLIATNPDTGTPFADLATEVPTKENGGISADGLTYTLKVRRDVKWHDGQPFTAKDVVFTYTTLAKKELGSSATSQVNDRIESVTAPDDYTVVFKLKRITVPFLTDNMYRIAPEHILKDVPADKLNAHPFTTGDPAATIGTGPFKFTEFVRDDHLTLTKNADYFRGAPALDQYIFKVVKDDTVAVTQLKTGEADVATVNPSFADEIKQQNGLLLEAYDTPSFDLLFLQRDPAKTTLFQDKRVRQALAYALDRQALITAVRLGFGTLADGTMPPISWAYAPDQVKVKYRYDLARANQLFDEAGWAKGADGIRAKDGQRFSFTYWYTAGNKLNEQLAAAVQQMWRVVGVESLPKAEDAPALLKRMIDTHDFEVCSTNYSGTVDPDQSILWKTGGGLNITGFSNARVDELIAQGLGEFDQAKRKQIYLELQDIIADELPGILLDFPRAAGGVNRRVKNLRLNAVNYRWNAHNWWVEDGR